MRKRTCIQLQNTYKKGTRKPGRILIILVTVLTISFRAFIQAERVSNFTS